MKPGAKRILFKLILLLFVYLLLEALAFGMLSVLTGKVFSFAEIRRQKEGTIRVFSPSGQVKGEPDKGDSAVSQRVLHPYLGFVYQPGSTPLNLALPRPVPFSPEECQVNGHGLFGTGPFPEVRSHHAKILILGGSVANLFYCLSRRELSAELAKIPRFSGKSFDFYAFSFEGYKQPQQLAALSFFLVQGAVPDLVITVDGFNEVALNEIGYAIYPEHWMALTGGIRSRDQVGAVGRIAVYQDWRRSLAESALNVNYSVMLNLLWSLSDRVLEGRIRGQNILLGELLRTGSEYSFQTYGPRIEIDLALLPEFGAAVWRRSVIQMQALARANGFACLHVLQPNLHLAGSKPLAPSEQQLARRGQQYDKPVKMGYPLIRSMGAGLKAAGVPFLDLSDLFRDEAEALYVDECCHFNKRGNDLMAGAIGREVRALMVEGSTGWQGGPERGGPSRGAASKAGP